MRSEATTVAGYLASLPDDRRQAMEAVREVILNHLPEGYEEAMNWGMITYQVPLAICPDTYNGQPLMYAGLASQKRHMAIYLTGIYADDATRKGFEDAWKATGKRLDAGKTCVRFTRLENVPLDLIGETIARFPVAGFLALVATVQRSTRK